MRAAFESMVRAKQDEICAAVSALDGTPFREDAWTRPGGGGGISRVLQGGNVRRGARCSAVPCADARHTRIRRCSRRRASTCRSCTAPCRPTRTGQPRATRARRGPLCSRFLHALCSRTDSPSVWLLSPQAQAGPVPFFAAGISSVMHPHNPMAPTMHFNYRYFETDAPSDSPGAPRAWWFGGGTDLTPSYLFKDDVTHFHRTYKDVCDAHDPAFYGRFKQWADDYFVNKHRGERRGLGGIFFDDMNDRPAEKLLAFATDAAAAVVPSYLPIVAKRKDEAFTDKQREWQQLRRGRYGAHAAAA